MIHVKKTQSSSIAEQEGNNTKDGVFGSELKVNVLIYVIKYCYYLHMLILLLNVSIFGKRNKNCAYLFVHTLIF